MNLFIIPVKRALLEAVALEGGEDEPKHALFIRAPHWRDKLGFGAVASKAVNGHVRPQAADAALQQTGRFRPGAAAVRAFPDGNIVAPPGPRGVDAAHVQPDQPPAGKARV